MALAAGAVLACGGPDAFAPGIRIPPVARIQAPASGATFRGGQPITIRGDGVDSEGAVPASRLAWRIDLVHVDHVHELTPTSAGGGEAVVTIPSRGHADPRVRLRVTLVATDRLGAADTARVELAPDTAAVTLATQPSGLRLLLDGVPQTTPFRSVGVVGMERDIDVVSPQEASGEFMVFTGWADAPAGTVSRVLPVPPRDTTVTATFESLGASPTPRALMLAPEEGDTWIGGQTIRFSGRGLDLQGEVPPGRFTWWADLHHDTHTHPFLARTQGITAGEISVPNRGHATDDVFYRFHLVVEDTAGVADTVSRDLVPRRVRLTFDTEPKGLVYTLDGQPRTGPVTGLSTIGIERDLGVLSPQDSGTSRFGFVAWSDGGAETHTVTPTADSSWLATFVRTGPANQPPLVSLLAPTDGQNVTVGTLVSIEAEASDSDGVVTRVQFYDGARLLGSDTTSPYAFAWTPTVKGPARISARAIDDEFQFRWSDTARVTVVGPPGGDNVAPTATLVTPSSGQRGLVAPLVLRANASDDVGVVGVLFQVDGEDVAEVTQPPYEVTLPSLAGYTTGAHRIRVRARDAAGNVSPWSGSPVTFAGSVDLPEGFTRTAFVTGLPSIPTTMAFAPDGRLFIANQGGIVHVVKDGVLLPKPFVTVPALNTGELGLVGLAFHPSFATNGWVYLNYTVEENGIWHNRISRVTAAGDTAAAGITPLVELPQVFLNGHIAGALHFGPDGKLYVAYGDNFSPALAQDLTVVNGKILRFNDDGTIPADNPYAGTANGLARAIWAIGLRNPFTMAFQAGTGRFFINDVGEGFWEEVNEGAPRANYGWPQTEGPTNDPRFTTPFLAYHHFQDQSVLWGQAVIGGSFYHPDVALFPANYIGDYFFGDYVQQWVARIDLDNDDGVYTFARFPGAVTDVRTGPDGGLYVLSRMPDAWGVWRVGR